MSDATSTPPSRFASRPWAAAVLSLAALAALAAVVAPPVVAHAAHPSGLAVAQISPEAFLAAIAPAPDAPVVVGSREDAVASELMLRSHLISAKEAARAAHALCEAARQEGHDPLLFLAVISVESGFDPLARSAVGAQGLMQLMPGTAKALARQERMAWAPGQSFDPVANVRLGVRYIALLERQFGHRLDLALTAYNRGPAATHRLIAAHGQLPQAIRDFYATPVLRRFRALRSRYGRLSWARSPLF